MKVNRPLAGKREAFARGKGSGNNFSLENFP
jgi:hypothetical protein